jgi:hypothetical protein
MALSTLASQVLPWAAGFHGLFWASRAGSSALFPTYRELEEHEKGYWAASVVSNIHAGAVCWLAGKALLETPLFLTTADFGLSTPASLTCSKCFLGYIISDLVLALWYNKKWAGMTANLTHHTFILICWGQLIAGKYGQLFSLVGALCEGSTPFVNFRWFLDKMGMKESPLYLYNGLSMTLSFFVLRVVGFLWAGTRLVAQREGLVALPAQNSALFVLSYMVGTGLQLFWFNKIFKGAMKALGYGPKKRVKTAEETINLSVPVVEKTHKT